MSSFLSGLSKAVSSGAGNAADQISRAYENTEYWKGEAKNVVVDKTVKTVETVVTGAANFVLKDDLAGNFGEGLAEYQGKRVGVFVGAMLSQAIDVGIDTATGKAIPMILNRTSKLVAQSVEKATEYESKKEELFKIGKEINTASNESIVKTVEAVGKGTPKVIAMAGSYGEKLSIVTAGTLQVVTDNDGRRDINDGINNIKEDFSNLTVSLGAKVADGFIAISSNLPEAIRPESVKRFREARNIENEVEINNQTPRSLKG